MLIQSFFQNRKIFENLIIRFMTDLIGHDSYLKIFPHGEIRKDMSSLGNVTNPQSRDEIIVYMGDVLPMEKNLAALGRGESHDAPQGRRFTNSISSQEADDLLGVNFEGDAVQDVAFPVKRMDVLEVKNGFHIKFPGRPPELRDSLESMQEAPPQSPYPDRKQ